MKKDEAYWRKKHPQVTQLYNGRPLPNGNPYSMDVRRFIWDDDGVLRQLIKKEGLDSTDISDAVQVVQKWVVDHIKYVSDTKLGAAEYWLFPAETEAMRTGDCEDGSFLMASMILHMIPSSEHWRVRVAAGMVQSSPTAPQGGHAYVTFCRPQDNEWVIVDWCYNADHHVKVKDKILHKDRKEYREIWFSFNADHAWSHITFDLSGRLRKNV